MLTAELQKVLDGQGASTVWHGVYLVPIFDAEGNEVAQVNPTGGKGGVLVAANYNICYMNTGKGALKAAYTKIESEPLFLGWLLSSPTGLNILTLV